MKQLLLLLTIHFLIFHQQKKDKKEKFFVTVEKVNTVNAKPQKDWKFLRKTTFDSVYSPSKLVTYNLNDYSYLMASQ